MKIINDPVYDGFLTIEDDLILKVLMHPFFIRMTRIKQLGFTYLVYPGAMHTRFSHALGTLNLMNRALDTLLAKGVYITKEELLGARLAILLHDVGHGPFSHTMEYMLANIHHEDFSKLFMQRLNNEMGGGLDTAIAIFDDSYPKHFLHQLVSSQLDMDRLDYLGRDSFFTGVSEGIVGTDRIISMLNVYNDELVVDEKGIYSVEKFIISRRLMYWQVYLHKTVIAADALLLAILNRARELSSRGDSLGIEGVPLNDFLTNRYEIGDFVQHPDLLDRYSMLDDSDIICAIKGWMSHPDMILRTLSESLVNRRLGAVKIAASAFNPEEIERLRTLCQQQYHIDPRESEYFVSTGVLKNHAYDYNDQEISVLYKDGRCLDIGEASDQLDRHFLEKQVTKYYICFPKELRKLL